MTYKTESPLKYVPNSELELLASKIKRLETLLDFHRRFHRKAYCPGRDCFVCNKEDELLDGNNKHV